MLVITKSYIATLASVPDHRGKSAVWSSAVGTWVAYPGSKELRDWVASKSISMDYDSSKKGEVEVRYEFEKGMALEPLKIGEAEYKYDYVENPIGAKKYSYNIEFSLEATKGEGGQSEHSARFSYDAPKESPALPHETHHGAAKASILFSGFKPMIN